MKEEILKLKFFLKAGQATVAPPVGPLLSKQSINAGVFVKQYNDATKDFIGKKFPVKVIIYNDKTFDFYILKQTTSDLLKSRFILKKEQNVNNNTFLDKNDLICIFNEKKSELNTKNLDKGINIIEGTLKNMNIPYKK